MAHPPPPQAVMNSLISCRLGIEILDFEKPAEEVDGILGPFI
jgi:hypothetical protein